MALTRNIAWMPVYFALIMFSVYELWQVWGQVFLYVDDGRDVPTILYLTKYLCLIGILVGFMGIVVIAVRWANRRIRLSQT
jgi:hypothetical protein